MDSSSSNTSDSEEKESKPVKRYKVGLYKEYESDLRNTVCFRTSKKWDNSNYKEQPLQDISGLKYL